jgi:hypothetical protein
METYFLTIIILKIITLAIMGCVMGGFGYFLDFCLMEGSVFGSYLPWLAKCLVKRFKRSEHTEVMLLPKGVDRDNEFIARALDIGLYKMLGGCAVCFNVHLCTIAFVILNLCLDFGWWYLPVFTISAHIILRKLLKL